MSISGERTEVVIPAIGATFATRTQEHIFRSGINYHFDSLAR